MKFLTLAALLAFSSLASFAASVQYSTTGTICPAATPSCAANFQNLPGGLFNILEVKFVGISSSSVTPNPSTIGQLGHIDFTCITASVADCANQSVAGLSLTILVHQTVPSVGSGLIMGSFTGTMSGTASNAFITWSTPTIMIAPIRYTALTNAGNQLALAPPSTGSGITTINAQITDTSIPEPGTYALIGGALLGLGMLRRKK